VRVINFISDVFNLLIYLCFNVQISQKHKSDGLTKTVYTFNRKRLWTTYLIILFDDPVQKQKWEMQYQWLLWLNGTSLSISPMRAEQIG